MLLTQNLNWENIGHFGVLKQSLTVFGHCFFMGIIIRIIQYLPVCHHVSQTSHLLSQTTLLYHCHASLFNIYLFAPGITCNHNYMTVPLSRLIIQYLSVLPPCITNITDYHQLHDCTTVTPHYSIFMFATRYHRYHTIYHQLHDCTTATPHYSILTCLPPGITPVITNYMTVPLPRLIIQYLPVCHQVSHLLSPTT